MSAREKARGLVKLALDESAGEKERINAAMRCVKLINKYNLLASPLDGLLDSDNETVSAAANIVQALTNPMLVDSVKKVGRKIGQARARRRHR